MELRLLRYSTNFESTLGILFVDNVFHCYSIEDTHRRTKIKGKTRIPSGRYEIKLRKFGRIHEKYSKKFKKIHRGTLEICGVPNFEDVLIHIENTSKDTMGYILVGDWVNNNFASFVGRVWYSTKAYKRLYETVVGDLIKNKKVYIKIEDK